LALWAAASSIGARGESPVAWPKLAASFIGDSAILLGMSEGLLFLKPLHLDREGTCTDWDVREGKPSGRAVGRIFLDVSTNGLWFWCLNDRGPSPAVDRGYAPTRAKAMLALKHRWRERGRLKPGEMQMGRPKWMDSHPNYGPVAD
jgi:hypothetical protein